MQLGSVAMTAFTVGLFALQMNTEGTFRFFSSETKHTLVLYGVLYVLVGAVWAGLNAWGLRRRVRLAHWSSYVFAAAQILTCFGTVFGAGLFFLLSKREMRGYYDARIDG